MITWHIQLVYLVNNCKRQHTIPKTFFLGPNWSDLTLNPFHRVTNKHLHSSEHSCKRYLSKWGIPQNRIFGPCGPGRRERSYYGHKERALPSFYKKYFANDRDGKNLNAIRKFYFLYWFRMSLKEKILHLHFTKKCIQFSRAE